MDKLPEHIIEMLPSPDNYEPGYTGQTEFERMVQANERKYPLAHEVHARLKMNEDSSK